MPTSAPVYDDSTPWELVIPFAIIILVTTGCQIYFLREDYRNHIYDKAVIRNKKRQKEKKEAEEKEAREAEELERKAMEPKGMPTTTPANMTAATTRAGTPTRTPTKESPNFSQDPTRVNTPTPRNESSTSLTESGRRRAEREHHSPRNDEHGGRLDYTTRN